ncbi:M56 family metallopeptidase [Pedobacter sp. Leaf176]|uniref:M56 family metallopeptidase n=1 Tax=Pedobacter sp. Leaf176 TaxID=1736286 RepID=UPI0009E96739|nr:M56 family metallopeptidase [Pedobacter sp. Leaf176]
MNWLYYLLEANLYMTIFYGFYRLFLHKETFYALNRYYLVLSSLFAFLIPSLQLGFLTREIVVIEEPVYQQIHIEATLLNTENILLSLYALVVLIFFSKIAFGFRHIFKLLRKPNKTTEDGITVIELADTKTAFSFFNMLFIDPELPNKNTILMHEMAHIHQKHSFDILFFELIRSLSWFNPIAHFLKRDIKLIHEFLADEETTNKGMEKYEYALFLIQNSYGEKHLQLTNQIFNSSILKRRISMLNQKKSAKWARLRLLLILPIVGGMLCTSTLAFTKDYGAVDLFPKKNIQVQDTVKRPKAKEIVIAEPLQTVKKVKLDTPPPSPIEPPVIKKVKRVKLAPPPPPPVEPPVNKKVKSVKLAPPPPAEPKSTKVEVLEIKLSPPPPPVEPPAKKDLTERVVKGYPLKNVQIKAQTPKSQSELAPIKVKGHKTQGKTTVKPEPVQKNDDKDVTISIAKSASTKAAVQIKDVILKEIKDARSKVATN